MIFRQDVFNRVLDEQEEVDTEFDREIEIEEDDQVRIFRISIKFLVMVYRSTLDILSSFFPFFNW